MKVEGEILDQTTSGFVQNRSERGVVQPELLEIGQHGKRYRGVPGIFLGLIDCVLIGVNVHRRFFRFDDEPRKAVDAEQVIGLAQAGADAVDRVHRRLDDDLGIQERPLLDVAHIPAKQIPKRIKVVQPQRRFLVLRRFELLDMLGEAVNEFLDCRCGAAHWI